MQRAKQFKSSTSIYIYIVLAIDMLMYIMFEYSGRHMNTEMVVFKYHLAVCSPESHQVTSLMAVWVPTISAER